MVFFMLLLALFLLLYRISDSLLSTLLLPEAGSLFLIASTTAFIFGLALLSADLLRDLLPSCELERG
jgi:hypothetical protein